MARFVRKDILTISRLHPPPVQLLPYVPYIPILRTLITFQSNLISRRPHAPAPHSLQIFLNSGTPQEQKTDKKQTATVAVDPAQAAADAALASSQV